MALVCVSGAPGKVPDEWAASREARIQRLNETQFLGIAGNLRDGGRLAPLLVVDKGSRLEARAKEYSLPFLVSGPLLRFRLWRWQRGQQKILIQTFGRDSMRLGRIILGMRKKGSASLAHAFFMKEPDARQIKCKAMLQASHVLCGTNHIAERIREDLGDLAPVTVVDEPGLELENWPIAGAYREGRFVFGMAQSLDAQSGALQVIRAMAALWQRDDLPPWEVRMFGAGPRYQEVLGEAENLGVASRLCLLADQPLNLVIQSCHAWLAPGTSNREFPETSWAGIAAGIPVICDQSVLHRERFRAVEDAPQAALKVTQHDPQALARAMICLMKDQRLRTRLAKGALSLRPEIGIAAMAQRTCAFFENWARELEERDKLLKNGPKSAKEKNPAKEQENISANDQEMIGHLTEESGKIPLTDPEKSSENHQAILPENDPAALLEKEQENLPEIEREMLPESEQENPPEIEQAIVPEKAQEKLSEIDLENAVTKNSE